ncbi:hypothetical protein C0991_011618 [Blastosporella zonata]|nr:hypothetical protein C0991_011618 [Blastosporella zonata]
MDTGVTTEASTSALQLLSGKLSQIGLTSAGEEALLTCQADISSSVRRPTPSRVSFLETDVGVATLVLLHVLGTEGPINRSPFFKNLALYRKTITDAVNCASDLEDDTCEVLYGRAGLLYALLLIRSELLKVPDRALIDQERLVIFNSLQNLVSDEALQSVVDSMIAIGRMGASQYNAWLATEPQDEPRPQLLWSWHGKRYLGAAHGVVERYASDLVKTLEWLVYVQDSTGNWPSKAPDDAYMDTRRGNELVQWCHGASGILVLLAKTSQQRAGIVLDQQLRERVDTAITKGARLIYRHGLLNKGIGICHGVAGSVYALLAASQTLDDRGGPLNNESAKYLRKALHLALLAVEHENFEQNGKMRIPDRPWSLYEGAAGMCCVWVDVLRSLAGQQIGGIPGFDDL